MKTSTVHAFARYAGRHGRAAAVRRRRQPPIRFHRPLLELNLLPSCTLLNNARLWPRSR